ncbi:MAG: DNA-binding protein [Marmoricola sp.]|nr:DNA-binding protein [Marmoricola sp.]
MSSEHKSRLRTSISRWANQDHDEARELRKDTRKAGLVCIGDVADRERIVVQGTLRTVTLRPRGGVPALEAELYDGTGSISLVWLGRRRIAGIAPGTVVRVEGRTGLQDDARVMYNPRYSLRPTSA